MGHPQTSINPKLIIQKIKPATGFPEKSLWKSKNCMRLY
jgi:hypothetical protein